MEIIRVENTKIRDALMNHVEGETVYCNQEQQAYIWHNGKWNEIESQTDVSGEIKVNYRDLVISAISNFSPFNAETNEKYQVLINKWNEKQNHRFYMLYGRELDYFTLFEKTENISNRCFGKEVLTCLADIGSLIYIEDFTDEDDIIIFWIKTPEAKITEVYLFDYTKGVVPFI